jgi:hypothetical protein
MTIAEEAIASSISENCGITIVVAFQSGNDGGNGAAEKNYNFKTCVIGGSRSPLCSATYSGNDANSASFDLM